MTLLRTRAFIHTFACTGAGFSIVPALIAVSFSIGIPGGHPSRSVVCGIYPRKRDRESQISVVHLIVHMHGLFSLRYFSSRLTGRQNMRAPWAAAYAMYEEERYIEAGRLLEVAIAGETLS